MDSAYRHIDTSGHTEGVVMSLPARKFEREDSMETHSIDARISVLEAHYQHIQADVHGLRDDVKGIRQELKELSAKFDAKLAELTQRFETRFSSIETKFDMKFCELQKTLEALKLSRVWDRVWMLLSMGAMLGVMARGFKWI
jgi:chromosome segregation ATPase